MANFINFIPASGQINVPKTTIVGFTILTDGYGGAQIGTLSAFVDGNQVISSGGFVNGYTGKISSSVGKYVVGIYPKAPNFISSASQINVSLQVLDDYNNVDAYNYSFFTSGYGATTPTIPSLDSGVASRICDSSKPEFPPTEQGLVAALDAGTGTEVDLSWLAGAPSNDGNIVYYNVYYSINRNDVFDGKPKFLIDDTSATIGGLNPGDTHYFGVRIAEFNPSLVTTNGLKQVGPNMYRYPETTLDSDISGTSTLIPADTNGFAESGLIILDGELIRYSSLLPTGFVVQTRGYSGTLGTSHSAGESIYIYPGREDSNLNVVLATSTFQKPNYALTWNRIDGYGNDGYRDGYDGYDAVYSGGPGANDVFDGYDGYFRYRQENFDNINTDGTNNDNSGDFKRFDYCGSWRALSPASFMQGQCRNSYFGGVQVDANGNRIKVSDIRTHMLQREELLLESTGEPFVLVRRMWTGIRCFCAMTRREHSHARCPNCHGTGFVQGYVQFFNPRRQDRRILVRVDPTTEDLSIVDRGGLEPAYEPSAWTIAFPQIKDRDFLVRFTSEGIEEWRYEVLNVERVRAFFAQSGAQKFRMKRIPKTDIIYQFPILRNATPQPGAIQTSVSSSTGLNPHSHQIVVPDGANLNTLKIATSVAEGHNHIIYNGVVQNIIGHTHTI